MLSTFGDYGDYFKFRKSNVDNTTFRLHYRATFGLLVMCSALATTHQFFGAPIDCMTNAPGGGAVNTYCWIHGTYTYDNRVNHTVQDGSPHPGVGPRASLNGNGEKIYHLWYQWVCFVLCLQALLCFIPHYIWESVEGGKLDMLIGGLDGDRLVLGDGEKDKRRVIVQYILRKLNTHNSYVFKFVGCEFLNLINVAGQMFLMDKFLGGQFTKYGTDMFATAFGTDLEDRIDPLNLVFPKMTKCDFFIYGASGTIEKFDSLCLLPMNIINEKMYVLIWFWFVVVITWTAIHLIFRLVSIINGTVRLVMLRNRAQSVNKDDLDVILRKCHYGDWFLLMQIGKSINPAIFHEVLLDLRDRIDRKRADNYDD